MHQLRIKQLFTFIAVLWSLFVILLVFWSVSHDRTNMTEVTTAGAFPYTMLGQTSLIFIWFLGLCGLGMSARNVFKRFREISVLSEQSARKEQESSRQKDQFEAMFNSITDAVVLVDIGQRIVKVNPAFTEYFGYSFEEVAGSTTEFLYIDPEAYYKQCRIRYNTTSELVQSLYEIEYKLQDGTVIPTETMGTHVLDQDDEVTGYYLMVIRDVAQRKQVEREAASASERSQGAEIAANAGSCIWDVTSGSISWSDNLYKIHDLRPEDFDGQIESVMNFIHPDDFDAVQHMIHKLFLDKRPQQLTYRVTTSDGVEKDIQSYTHLITDDQGKVQKVIAMIQDVTVRKKAEKEKELNEERLNILLKLNEMVDVSTTEIIEYGLEGCVSLSGSKIGYFYFTDHDQFDLDLFTWSSAAIKNCTADPVMKYSLEEAGIWADSIRTEKPVIHNDYKNESSKKGVPEGHNSIDRHMSVPIFDEDKIVAVVGVANNEKPYDESDVKQVTLLAQGINRVIQRNKELEEKEDLELQLQRAYKLEAINTLADGIAHDFNNVLGIIFINADVALEDIPADNPAKVNLERIVQASTRAKDLVKQIMVYSHQADQKLIMLAPETVVNKSIRFFESTAPPTVEIVEDICAECGTIEADPAQLQQLFLNLFSNAVYAMDGTGTLAVKGAVVHLEPEELAGSEDLRPGTYFKLSVSDMGTGLNDEARKRFLKPLLASKQQGDGTTMGLSLAMGIVHGNNGMLTVERGPEEGSTFHVFFPIVDSADMLSDEETDDRLYGTERILFVDDEVLLAEMTAEMLKRKGYQVNVQADGLSALEVFQANPKGFDLVVTDQTMSKMTGTELAVEMMKIRPDLPVILVSGYSKKVSVEKVLELGIKDFLYKPFDTRNLLRIIRKVLESV